MKAGLAWGRIILDEYQQERQNIFMRVTAKSGYI
jgi:hypothetical protein